MPSPKTRRYSIEIKDPDNKPVLFTARRLDRQGAADCRSPRSCGWPALPDDTRITAPAAETITAPAAETKEGRGKT